MFSRRLHALASFVLVIALGMAAGALGGGDDNSQGLKTPVIMAAPTNPTTSTSATFGWDARRGRKGSYQCRLDGAVKWTDCTSPATYTGLAVGVHAFDVVAVDSGGTLVSTAAHYLWSIEPAPASVPATPSITSGPPSSTTSTIASFAFSDATSGVSFLCKLDAASYAGCTSPKAFSGLAVGQHTFNVKARNAAGLESGVASQTWTITTAPPPPPPPPSPTPPATPTIGSGPPSTTTDTSASFSFSSSTTGVSYLCRLDAAAFAACTSPKSYSGLAIGQHTFDVKARDSIGLESGTATRTWQVQASPPPATPPATPTIDSAPKGTTTSTSASIAFSDTTSGITLLCRLDAAAFAACTSPKSYTGLAVGTHSFDVKARDGSGLESGLASVSWQVAAATTTFGNANVFSNVDLQDQNIKEAYLVQGLGGNVTKLTGYVSGLGPGSTSENVKGVIYADSGGAPGALLGTTQEISIAKGQAWGWVDFPFSSAVSTPAAPVWIGWIGGLNDNVMQWRVSSNGTNRWNPDTYADGPSTSFGSGTNQGLQYSLYASVGGSSPPPPPPPPGPTAPATPTISSVPASVTNDTSASFSFSSSTAGVTYLCRLDAAAFAACTSSKSYSGLAAGSHSFDVKAQDSSGLQSGVASASWTVDLTLPTVTLTSPAPGTVLSNTVTVTASAADNIKLERVEFRVDGTLRGTSTIAPHTFSWDTTKDSNGNHTLDIRSYDVAGNESAPLTQTFSVSNTTSTLSCTVGIPVDPGIDVLQSLVSSKPDGTTFCLLPGVHRITSAITPRSGDSFVGLPGAVLSGAKLLTGFTQSGSAWYVGGQTMQGYGNPGYTDPCGPPYGPSGSDLCLYSNDVYFDDSLLTRVGSLSALGPGEFFFDYGADRVYIGNNPAGHKVEVGVATQAVHAVGTGTTNVHFSGFTVEKFATPAGDAALQGRAGYSFDNMEVRLNHGGGILGFASVTNSYIHDNGQFGVSVDNTTGAVIDGNELASNHRTPIVCWHSADVKVMRTVNTVISNNYAHDGTCGGLWQDWDNKGALVEGNRVEHVGSPGIEAEASCNTIFRNNIVKDSGWGQETANSWIDGSAILAYSSHDVEIYGNTVEATGTGGGRHGINGANVDRGTEVNCGALRTYNLRVHNNQIKETATGTNRGYGVAAGMAGTISQPFTTQAFFDNNAYTICSATNFGGAPSSSATYWDTMSWSQWRSQGEDPHSTVSYVC